jgi:hypothetical protein
MNKIKLLALFALSAMFLACGSQDGSAPSLKKTQLEFISPFDTLKVEFDSEIVNIDKLDSSNISPSTNLTILFDGKKSSKTLSFVGGDTTLGGSRHFASGLTNASITFKKLVNSDGYRRDSTTLYFSTYPILDNLDGNNDTLERAIDLDPFLTNVKTITFAGVLDHKIGASKFNMEDYYKISLRMNDTLIISANSKDSLNINITEPEKNSVNKIIGVSAKKEKKESLIIGGGHLNEDDLAGKLADFYIKIYDVNSAAPPNPYTISITLNR